MQALSKAHAREIKLLHHKKNRRLSGSFIVEGTKWITEIVAQKPDIVQEIVVREEGVLFSDHIAHYFANEMLMAGISVMAQPPGALAVCKQFTLPMPKEHGFYMALDAVADPGNLGTILRTADWFGASGVLLTQECVELFNPKVVQASMGSLLRVPVLTAETADLFAFGQEELTHYRIDLTGDDLLSRALPRKGVYWLGSEANGFSETIKQKIKQAFTIPSFSSGKTESLNVAMAAAVLCTRLRIPS